MHRFKMCEECQREYDQPADRRFHAQPNACPVCGPQLSLCDKDGLVMAQKDEALTEAARLLAKGEILAIKGLGGFHLACDATDEDTVRRLRQRKNREEKPLAVMVSDIKAARQLCDSSPLTEKELCSPAAPIVIARARGNNGLAPSVAPSTSMLGVMLAYTPLHHLLLEEFSRPLVMTSGNFSEEPICIDNDEAFGRLAGIADHFLIHDRDIYMRSDDSVMIEMGDRLRTLRRGRGYVPGPIQLDDGPSVLAVGGELKGAICLTKGDQAFPGQHLGDIKNLEAYSFLQETIAHLGRIFEVEPQLVVHDLHPAYLSTRWATEEQDLPVLAVQHHHAHLASCLAENGSSGPAIGIILDGTGYGADRTIWGGEILLGDLRDCKRIGCLEPMPLPGGDAAIKAPWRTALAYLERSFAGEEEMNLPFLDGHDTGPVREMLRHDLNCPLTSSCGRLFDAVEAMSGGRQTIAYEGQAAIELMEAAGRKTAKPYNWDIIENGDIFHLELRSLVRQIAGDIATGEKRSLISRRFHSTLAEMMVGAAKRAREIYDINSVVLSGGVFNNYLLLETLGMLLAENDFEVLTHALVPAGDGGVSLGQAVIGRKWLLDN
jgi:hydrogenase maturation protein HypF